MISRIDFLFYLKLIFIKISKCRCGWSLNSTRWRSILRPNRSMINFPSSLCSITSQRTQRYDFTDPPIINGLIGFQALGSMPRYHTLLHCSKIVSVSSPTRFNLTLLILLLFIIPHINSYKPCHWFLSIYFRLWCFQQTVGEKSTTTTKSSL